MEIKNGRLDYFSQKNANIEHAKAVIRWAEKHRTNDIQRLSEETVLMPELKEIPDGSLRFDYFETEVIQCSTVDAIVQEYGEGHKVCALNFASYKNPGGMFLEGSMAQEESLCHASLLYPVLSSGTIKEKFYDRHGDLLNKALYHSDMLYTPSVPFWKGDHEVKADIITCAAPNKRAAQKYQNVPDDVCRKAMEHRIASVLHAAYEQQAEVLVLGAFGCGVFGNDVTEVAEIFRDLLSGKFYGSFRRVVFAVLDAPSCEAMRGVLIR